MDGDARYALIVNPSAGGGRARSVLPVVERGFAARGLAYRIVRTEDTEHGVAAALEASADGEVPVAMSGDGMIGQIGGALAGAEATLGIVPGGRGNDLARVLGIPSDPDGALDVLTAGSTRRIDVGEANGRRFLGIASCGFDSECNRLANEVRIVRGNLVYAYSALRTLAAWRPARFELALDGEPRELVGYAVVVANSKAYGGGMFIAPAAELDDGLLDVVLEAEVSKLRFLANLPKVFKGTHVAEPEVTVVRAREVKIAADRPFAVYADGDHLTDLPATVRLLPRALRVLAPPPAG
jgi:YegS/Rv2252/BmrU family lipid kinase